MSCIGGYGCGWMSLWCCWADWRGHGITVVHAARTSGGSAGIAGRGRLAGVIVILDPGHGGEDPGASLQWGRQPVREAALTYRTALEVGDALRGQGADVRYTVRSRTLDPKEELSPLPPILPDDAVLVSTDRPLRARVRRSPRQLWQRADFARQVWTQARRKDPAAARDVFFLSLHFDDIRQPDIRGGLVCVDRRAGPPPAFGVSLARSLSARGWARSEQADGQPGLTEQELGVLNPLYNPIPQKALLEVTTLSNMDDYLHASDPAWRAQIAQLIAQSVADVHQG